MYIIVAHAADGFWEKEWETDPKKQKQYAIHSVHGTPEGEAVGVQDRYIYFMKAKQDCDKLNDQHPEMGYGVCPVLEV